MERLRQSRFADPRVCGDQDHLTVPCLCLSPSAVKEFEFFGAPNDRRLISAQRLESAAWLALAIHANGRVQGCESSDLYLVDPHDFQQFYNHYIAIIR